MPVSSIPPTHAGTPRATHESWIRRASITPPTRPTFTLTIPHAPASSAASAGAHRQDRLVEADRRCHPRGERRVQLELVGRERLLDHQQPEAIERSQSIECRRVVPGVRVDLQREVRELGTDDRDLVHVPPRHDLELHAPVSLLDVAVDLLQELLDRGGDADRDTDVDGRAWCRPASRTARLPADLQLCVEDRHLDARLRRSEALDVRERGCRSPPASRGLRTRPERATARRRSPRHR